MDQVFLSKTRSYGLWGMLRSAVTLAEEVVCETLWPTRCAICDTPGQVLCDQCERELPYIDIWQACPICGCSWGLFQCTTCNEVMLANRGRERLPFAACASVMRFDERTGTLVRVFKDAGEQRLAHDIARFMARYVSPAWDAAALTYVPSSRSAYRRRGYDHAALIANELACEIDIPVLELLERPNTRDQRKFGSEDRFRNLAGSFRLRDDAAQIRVDNLLLIDDVFTTGATLCAASDALKEVAQTIYCLTFARV